MSTPIPPAPVLDMRTVFFEVDARQHDAAIAMMLQYAILSSIMFLQPALTRP